MYFLSTHHSNYVIIFQCITYASWSLPKKRVWQNWVFWSFGLSEKCFAEAVSKIFMPTFDASDFFTNFLKPYCEQQFQFLSKTSFIVPLRNCWFNF